MSARRWRLNDAVEHILERWQGLVAAIELDGELPVLEVIKADGGRVRAPAGCFAPTAPEMNLSPYAVKRRTPLDGAR